MFIVVSGTLIIGLSFHGPYHSHSEASAALGMLGNAGGHVVRLEHMHGDDALQELTVILRDYLRHIQYVFPEKHSGAAAYVTKELSPYLEVK
jgi:hypothetical protein